MGKILTGHTAITDINPRSNVEDVLEGIDIVIAMQYLDSDDNSVVSTSESFDAWSVLSADQKVAMQDIWTTILTHVETTYGAAMPGM